MSTTSLQHFPHSYSPFSSSRSLNRMAQSQTSGLDTLAEGSQYALEQLQMSREAAGSGEATDSVGKPKDQFQVDNDNHHNNHSLSNFKNPSQRDPLSKLVRQSGKTRPRHLFDGESAALVTNAISYAPNATGRTRALIVLVEFPTATRTLYCGTCHTDRSAQSSD